MASRGLWRKDDLLYKDKERTYQLLFHAFFVASGMDAAAEDHSL